MCFNHIDFNLTAAEMAMINTVSQAFRAKGKKVLAVLNIGGVKETATCVTKAFSKTNILKSNKSQTMTFTLTANDFNITLSILDTPQYFCLKNTKSNHFRMLIIESI